MGTPTASEAFAVWREDAAILTAEAIPDTQVPIIGLVAVYAATNEQKTVYDWRRYIARDASTSAALAALLPDFQREEFNDTETFSLWDFERQVGSSSRAWTEHVALHDGVPEGKRDITAREYFLGRFAGQAMYNSAVTITPLNVYLAVARPPLEVFFPKSLEYLAKHK